MQLLWVRASKKAPAVSSRFGWLAPEDYPLVVNPASGALWSANARVVEGPPLVAIGDGGYALGARATQIRYSLLALTGATEAVLLERCCSPVVPG